MERGAQATPEMQAGDCYECEICGFSVIVDEVCGCAEVHELICCNQPMERVPVEAGDTGTGEKAERPSRTEKVSAAGLQMYLKGMEYPASKQQLIEQARSRGARKNVMSILEKFTEKEYARANEVSREFGKLR